ncbi:maleylpyruvate isomerase family mycothiol-dependent enzyme [Gordonia sp. NPDC127522]|uniref:maleylpyruvate isomerase family mycothiol-dependent enzyme n=1 Tax=Gordonia sp. NPDC127522 TaxID=3345390 RepID=UPI00362BE8BC
MLEFARLERAEFAEMAAGLSPSQWDMPSLCAGWSVRDVVAHTIAYLGQSRTRLTINMYRARGDLDRLNAVELHRFAAADPAKLVRLLQAGIEPAGAGALYGGRVALIECMVHQQDVRRAVGLPRCIPLDRVRASLNYARISPVIRGARLVHGVRLSATDMDWTIGNGPEVRGSGEALLLTMTGRGPSVRNELTGDGVPLIT